MDLTTLFFNHEVFVLSMSSLACFDLVTSVMDFNFLWSDPYQCAQKVQTEQTLLLGTMVC